MVVCLQHYPLFNPNGYHLEMLTIGSNLSDNQQSQSPLRYIFRLTIEGELPSYLAIEGAEFAQVRQASMPASSDAAGRDPAIA